MTTTQKIVWRLKEQPTSGSLQGLVLNGILTKDEAREILFSSETEEDRDKKSLEFEIKFLRDLVERLSQGNNTRIVEVIKEIRVPYYQSPWYYPYQYWCGSNSGIATYTTSDSSQLQATNTSATSNFSDIKTF